MVLLTNKWIQLTSEKRIQREKLNLWELKRKRSQKQRKILRKRKQKKEMRQEMERRMKIQKLRRKMRKSIPTRNTDNFYIQFQ